MNICWYENEVIESMNRFEDSLTGQDIQPHYASFNELLNLCGTGKLLDLGTGTARLSQFCKNFEFTGADLPHIISGCAMRNYPQYPYRSVDLIEDNLAWIRKYDVVVLNGVIDIMQNGLYILERILTHANKYVLIHRQEITEEANTHSKINPSYNSNTWHSIINRTDFNNLLEKMGFDILKENSPGFTNWENNGSSFLLRNRIKDLSKYDSHPLRQLRNRIKQVNPCKIVIGGGDVLHDQGWIVTNIEELDVENEDDFEFFFGDKKVDNFFSEHVWEHLKNPQKAIENCYKYLKKGGVLRIAVPDGYHCDSEYIEQVRPGGTGSGADDHQTLWNYYTLCKQIRIAGFDPIAIEYFEITGRFRQGKIDNKNGKVKRSFKNDERNKDGNPNYTSLIIDAIC